MEFPREVRHALDEIGTETLEGTLAYERGCEGSKFHSPTPLILHEVTLTSGRIVMLCGTCKDNYAVVTLLLDRDKDSWPVRRQFGNVIRALAQEGR